MVKIPLIIPVMIPDFSRIVIEIFRILFALAMYHIFIKHHVFCVISCYDFIL